MRSSFPLAFPALFSLSFAPFLGCRAAGAREDRASEELATLYRADQEARQGDWSDLGQDELHAIAKADEARLARVLELVSAGALQAPADGYHAAMVLQHGSAPDHQLLAHILATAAAIEGDERGAWLSAASLDRFLQGIGRPQRFGTQYLRNGAEPWTQEPFDPSLPDAVRATFGVPPLAASRKRLEALNAALAASERTNPAPSGAATAVTEEGARSAIAKAWDGHLAAARSKDAAGVLAMYTENALTIENDGDPVRGRRAIEQAELQGFATVDVQDDVVHTTHELRLVGDVAYELGMVEGTVRPKGQAEVHVVYHFMATWMRETDGVWRLHCLVGRR